MPRIMKYAREIIMDNATESGNIKLAWAVLAQRADGKSDVIKITNHEEADRTMLENPGMFYKSGPFILN